MVRQHQLLGALRARGDGIVVSARYRHDWMRRKGATSSGGDRRADVSGGVHRNSAGRFLRVSRYLRPLSSRALCMFLAGFRRDGCGQLVVDRNDGGSCLSGARLVIPGRAETSTRRVIRSPSWSRDGRPTREAARQPPRWTEPRIPLGF